MVEFLHRKQIYGGDILADDKQSYRICRFLAEHPNSTEADFDRFYKDSNYKVLLDELCKNEIVECSSDPTKWKLTQKGEDFLLNFTPKPNPGRFLTWPSIWLYCMGFITIIVTVVFYHSRGYYRFADEWNDMLPSLSFGVLCFVSGTVLIALKRIINLLHEKLQ